jgi:hypothetical protein
MEDAGFREQGSERAVDELISLAPASGILNP